MLQTRYAGPCQSEDELEIVVLLKPTHTLLDFLHHSLPDLITLVKFLLTPPHALSAVFSIKY